MVRLDSAAKVKKLVFESVFKRALEISSSDALRDLSFEGDEFETCNGGCIGSSSSVYVLKVTVVGEKALGECSCPASAKAKDGLCKHIIALLLRRNDKLQEKLAGFLRARKQEAELDKYPIENIGSPQKPQEAWAKTSDGISHENESLPITHRPVLKQSSVKRSLPPWMLVVGSAGSGESLDPPLKSKRKFIAEKPPQGLPPTRLAMSNDVGGEKGSGEIDVPESIDELCAEVVEEPVVEDAENLEEYVSTKRSCNLRKPRRPRSRLEIHNSRQNEGEIESNKGDENVGARKSSSQVQRRSKSHRVVGKLFEVDSDLSDNERSTSCARNGGAALDDTMDDELLLLAQEHMANGGPPQDAQVENQSITSGDVRESPEKYVPFKKRFKYSMDAWKEMSFDVNPSAPLYIADNLDLETLKTYAHQADSLRVCQNSEEPCNQGIDAGDEALFPSLQTISAAEEDSMSASDTNKDSIANDMLGLIFGPSLTASVATPFKGNEVSSGMGDKPSNAGERFRYVEPSSSQDKSPKSAARVQSTDVRTKTEDLPVEYKAKKKSSLKDKIKMLLD